MRWRGSGSGADCRGGGGLAFRAVRPYTTAAAARAADTGADNSKGAPALPGQIQPYFNPNQS